MINIEVTQDFVIELSKKQNYSPSTFRVLFHFFTLFGNVNVTSLHIKRIAKNLSISENSVKRALKLLTDDNIILKNYHNKTKVDYYLNPQLVKIPLGSEFIEEETSDIKAKITKSIRISKSELSKEKKRQEFLKKLRERY
jgi:DNA-binding transcriptional regulator GbsR (MarR family)